MTGDERARRRPGRRCSRSTTRSSASSRASPRRRADRAETVSTFDALGRVLAADVRSQIDVPPEDNSEMDGYALRAGDVAAPGTVLRGQPADRRRQRRRAARAGHGGAHLHRRAGAGRRRRGRHAGAVQRRRRRRARRCGGPRRPVDPPPRRGRRARRARPRAPGIRLSPQALGMAASVGAATLQVARRPRVALFSTGDELAMPGETLKPGAIYNSNRFTLRGLIESLGARPRRPRHRPRPARRDARRAQAGGREQRPHRHLRRRLGRRGRPPAARRRAGRAPRPLADRDEAGQAARLRRGLPRRRLVGLVHRPAGQSGVVVRHLPARRPAGAAAPAGREPSWRRGRSRCAPTSPGRKPDRRREFLRVRRNDAGGLDLFGHQGSAVLTSTIWADGLVDNPPGAGDRAGRHGPLPVAARSCSR